MKTKEKQEIIDILKQWQQMIGVDKQRTKELISAVNTINTTSEIDFSLKSEIKRYLNQLAERIGYDPSESNNKIRDPETATERFAMYYLAVKKYSRTSTVDLACMEYFGKDRTTMIYWSKRSRELFEIKDQLFMHLIKVIAEKQIAA